MWHLEVTATEAFKRIITTGIWKIEVTLIRLQVSPAYRVPYIWFCQKWQSLYTYGTLDFCKLRVTAFPEQCSNIVPL